VRLPHYEAGAKALLPFWHEGELPHWTKPFVIKMMET